MTSVEHNSAPFLHTYTYNATNAVPTWKCERDEPQHVARPVSYTVAYERDLLLLIGKDIYDRIVSITELTREELDSLAEQLMDA